jgi:DNA polymerase-3 subunit epsilon
MTGGQAALLLDGVSVDGAKGGEAIVRIDPQRPRLKVVRASDEELRAHAARLAAIDKGSSGNCLWKKGMNPDQG